MNRVNPVYMQQTDAYSKSAQAFAASREGDPGWLTTLREEARLRFAEIGFPSTRLEEWRYTNVAAIAKLSLELTPSGCAGGESLVDALSRDSDALRERLARVPDAKDRGFALLNASFLRDGAVVRIPENESLPTPVRIVLSGPASGTASHPRVLIDVGAGASATVVIDVQPGADGSLTNLVADAEVGANARLDIVLLQPAGDEDEHFQVSNLSARVGRDGRLHTHTVSVGGDLVRNDLDVVLADEGAECHLRGLFLGSDARVVDNHTSVDHAVPHCSSHQLYKGILGGRSRGVFRGRVVVRPDAQKTDATQSNPNLLLGAGAEIDTKPQLEIYADDVKCSHGATVGRLDEDALFYLRSRGIGVAAARALLIEAFANEILDALPEGVEAAEVARGLQTVLEGADS